MENSKDKNKIKKILNMDIKDIKINFNKFNKFNKNKNKILEIKKEIVSFDINEDFIKVVTGRYYKNTLYISKCIESVTPKGSVEDGKILNEELILNELRNIISKNKIKSKYASFTTNSTLIINREMMIPKIEEDEIDTVISYEISKYLPINLNDYIIQTLYLSEVELNGSDKLRVYTICYPEKLARSYNDILQKLNLKPYSLDVKFNSLNKIINYSREINNQEYIISNSNVFVDIGALSTEINIYNLGEIDFTRIIKSGYRTLEGYTLNESSKYGVDYLLEEIERIIQFYKNKVRGNKIDKIYLLGEGSRLDGLDLYMSNKFDVEVELLNDIGFIEFDNKNNDKQKMYKYINAIGSIIRL